MPTTTDRSRALAVEPAEVSATFLRASLNASHNWTKLYLDGLQRALDFQLQLAESYASTGNQYVGAAAALADRADRARSEVAEAIAQTVEEAANTQAEIVTKTADRAAKTQAIVTKTAEKAAKAQAEAVTGPTEEPLPDYNELTAEQLVAKLPAVSQRTLGKVGAY